MNKASLIYDVKVKDFKGKILIDTGSVLSLISKRKCKESNPELRKCSKIGIMTAADQTIYIRNTTFYIVLRNLPSVKYKVDDYFSESITGSFIIIGCNFYLKIKYK